MLRKEVLVLFCAWCGAAGVWLEAMSNHACQAHSDKQDAVFWLAIVLELLGFYVLASRVPSMSGSEGASDVAQKSGEPRLLGGSILRGTASSRQRAA